MLSQIPSPSRMCARASISPPPPYNTLYGLVYSTTTSDVLNTGLGLGLGLGLGFQLNRKKNLSSQIRRKNDGIRAVNGQTSGNLRDEEAYGISPDGKRVFYDEQDIMTFLDPPKELIPLDPSSYNPAGYLWKKIDDIPEERRHRLLHLLNSRLISRIWGIAGTRYEDSKLAKKSASGFLSDGCNLMSLEFWNCRTSGGPFPFSLVNLFKKVMFCKDEGTFGRILYGGPILGGIANSYSPLYFTVRQHKEIMPTEQPCDFAYEFGDGLLDLQDYPQGFPKSVKHPWPFNDHVVVYVRTVGPGVLVGQAWQEGRKLEQVPKKLFGEILMVKDYSSNFQ